MNIFQFKKIFILLYPQILMHQICLKYIAYRELHSSVEQTAK